MSTTIKNLGCALLIALLSLGLDGCLLLVAGGAAEVGYVASKDQSPGTTVSDQWITTRIKSKLIADELVKARNINVDTSKHVVTLTGVVFSSREKSRAQALARGTKGVAKVISRLDVAQ